MMRVVERSNGCLTRVQIEEVVAADRADASLVAHLAVCAVCRAKTEAVRRNNQLIDELRHTQVGPMAHGQGEAPSTIPGYNVIREIHRGAQGVVFEAIQLATKRRVAVKVIGRGRFATTRQRMRFEREIEIVAALRHPNIAMLYESGLTAEGSAYFAMEYVDGVGLQECEDWPSVSPREAVSLFAKICRAVGYAHEHGVIHHDLKPSNIMVDHDGEPRVLDFGLAWAPHEHVERQVSAEPVFAGTFAYASPEQLFGRTEQIDIRSDVYSLGVMLYEMLTGTVPHSTSATMADLLVARRDGFTVSPRAHRDELDRDLEAIVLKALSPEQARRYRSASDLCEDLERFLDGRPILSRQDSLGYVLLKLIQRRRRMVAFSSVIAALMLALLVFAFVLLFRHEREQDKSMDTLAAFQQVLEAADPLSGLSTDTRLDAFLDHVGRNVEHHLSDQPDTAASIRTTLGKVALNMADYRDAEAHFAEALSLRRKALDEDDLAIAESLHNLGRAVFYLGRYDESATLYRQALHRRTAVLGPAHPDVANTMGHLASCLRRVGELGQAEKLLRDALRIRESHADVSPADLAASMNNLGSLLLETGQLDQALDHFERALAMVEQAVGPDDWRVAHALQNRATCLNALQRHSDAEADLLRAQEIWKGVVSADHPALARVEVEMARTSLHLGRTAEAEALVRAAIANKRTRLGDRHPDLAERFELLGQILRRQSRHEEAIVVLEEALEIRLGSTPANPGPLVDTITVLGQTFTAVGQFEDAERLLLKAFEIINARGPLRREQIAQTLNALIDLYQRWERDDAVKVYREELTRRGLARQADDESSQSSFKQP